MYTESENSSLRTGSFKVTDFNVDGSFYAVAMDVVPSRFVGGQRKLFKGQTGGKYHRGLFPPPLNPVLIGTETEKSASISLRTETVPGWGIRSWTGQLPAELVGRLNLLQTMAGHGPEMDPALRDVTLQKAYANVGANDFNGQLFLAELGETFAMLLNPLAGITKIHKKYSKGRKRLRELLKAQGNVHADLYLQYMFGISPFISDVQNIYKLVTNQESLANESYAKGTTKTLEKVHQYGVDTSYTTKFRKINYLWSGETTVKTTSKIYYKRMFSDYLSDMVNKWGFNPLNLPITLWETVPLSFVVDWFFGVKLWLSSFVPKPTLSMLGNTTTEKLTQTYKLQVTNVELDVMSYLFKRNLTDCTYEYTYERIIRQVNRPIPHTLGINQGINSIGKAVSSLALSWQKLKL